MTVEELVEVAVSLRLTGSFDPDEVTAALGIVPSDQWRVGQQGQAPKLRRNSDGWVLGLGAVAGQVGEQIDRAVGQLAQIGEPLGRVLSTRGIAGCLTVAVDAGDDGWPVVLISAAALAFLASSGLSLDVDII
ncbi:DUF4279 domain-containing protein [Nocardia bovistercoris]|uniref:DUF4279 domain-containing protein n=1 Tax=Nocardia bovistercoris TaxID=2785916 RepID=A0A931IGQ2_9NOCA|nr:DUF4279 domain-containing protein [Nocardia bovistercoris]MBH0781422.1 DUF4279 domain-containing protein [Nocardia bovistercoris]